MAMSLAWAEFISFWANWVLVGALAVGLFTTYGIVVSGNVKETALKRELAEASVKVGIASEEAAKANKTAGEANERAATLELKAKETELALEKERVARLKLELKVAPRLLTQAQQNELTQKLAGLEKQRVTIVASPSTSESEWFAQLLASPLADAGWKVELLPGTPTATILYPTGVIIQYRSGSLNSLEELKDSLNSKEALPANTVGKFLVGVGIDAVSEIGPGLNMPPNVDMLITVADK